MKILFYYLLQVIIASGILYAYYHFFLRNKRFHRYNRFYILAASLISILIPFLNIPVYFTHDQAKANFVLYTLSNISAPVYDADPITITTATQNWFTLQNLLYAAYILVATLVLLRIILSLRKIRLIIKRNPVEKIERIRFVNTEEPGTPFSFFKWLFWNKKIELQSEKGEQIFRHELFHIEQKHSLDIIFMELLSLIFWINPFFYLMKKEMKAIHEFLADQFAVKENDQWEYAELLLMQALNTQNHLTNPFFHNQIKRRIAMLTTSTKPGHQYLRKVLVLPVAAIVLALFAFKYKEKISEKDKVKDITNNSLTIQDTILPQSQKVLVRRFEKYGPPPAKVSPSSEQLMAWENSKIYGVWLDGKRIPNSNLKNYSAHEIKYYDISKLAKNAVNYGKHYYQVDLMTEGYYEKTFANWNPNKTFWFNTYIPLDSIPSKIKNFQNLLIVLDGQTFDKNKLNDIDIKDVESITVLKDASAIAKYGDKAKDGVIEISMKHHSKAPITDTLPSTKSTDNKIFEKVEVEASFPGGLPAWKKYLERNLVGVNPADKGAPNGTYTVYIQFVVDKEGNISDVKALTHYGYGMEDAAIKLIKKGPAWIPALQNGHRVKAYRKQPVTFVVTTGKTTLKEVTVNGYSNSQKKSNLNSDSLTNPLYVIDGKRYGTNPPQYLNPVQIESISVLKGVSAIAKYGDKGKNGVIEITTKNNADNQLKEGSVTRKKIVDDKIFEITEVPPSFPGGSTAWSKYLERTLSNYNPADQGAKAGAYTVIAQFLVDKEGNVSDIKTLTHFGYGMEDTVINIIKTGPKWNPAMQNGHVVKAYIKQPVTFIVLDEDQEPIKVTSKAIPGKNDSKTNNLNEVVVVNYKNNSTAKEKNVLSKEDVSRLKSIYPNPTNNSVIIPLNSEIEGKGTIMIYDETGNLKITTPINFIKGNNTYSQNISALAKGVYIINVIGPSKAITQSYKMIKE